MAQLSVSAAVVDEICRRLEENVLQVFLGAGDDFAVFRKALGLA
jgi:hypothetical protein